MNSLIVCAGKNSRFGGEKALANINGVSNLERIHTFLEKVVEENFIVVREDKKNIYQTAFPKGNYVTVQKSDGCGQAIRDALEELPENKYLIVWGDMFLRDNKFLEQIPNNSGLSIFTEKITNPYMCYDIDNQGYLKNAVFCHQDNIPREEGFTDRGIFLATKSFILPYLNQLTKDKRKEYHLLDTLPKMYADKNPATAIILKDSGIKSFNTQKELEEIIKND